MDKINKKIEEIADKKKYGKVVVEYSYQNGKIKKIIIKESDEVVLLS